MVNTKDCVWVTKAGYCRWHKELCCRTTSGACSACVRPIPERVHNQGVWYMNHLRLGNSQKDASINPNMSRGVRYGWVLYKTCERKRFYASFDRAREVAIETNRRTGMVLGVYECPFCHGYHLTKKVRRSLQFSVDGNTAA